MKTFQQIAGAIPFSEFKGGGKKKSPRKSPRRSVTRMTRRSRKKPTQRIKKRSSRRDNRKSSRKTVRKRVRGQGKVMKGACHCDKQKKYSAAEPSPTGFGYCSHCTPLQVTMKGTDGNLWENRTYSKGRRWVMKRNDMVGGCKR